MDTIDTILQKILERVTCVLNNENKCFSNAQIIFELIIILKYNEYNRISAIKEKFEEEVKGAHND